MLSSREMSEYKSMKKNCGKFNGGSVWIEGGREFSQPAISALATNNLYDCLYNKGENKYDQFSKCVVPWDPNMISYQIYERNGEIKRDVPLTQLPPFGKCEVEPRRNYSMYN
jgi:hypothetical protein